MNLSNIQQGTAVPERLRGMIAKVFAFVECSFFSFPQMFFEMFGFNTPVCEQFVECGGSQRGLDMLLQFGQFAVNGAVSAVLTLEIPKQTLIHINRSLYYVNNVP